MLDWKAAQQAMDFIHGSGSRPGKWTLPVLAALEQGPLRHNELLRVVGSGIRPKVFDGTLQRLESTGMVVREISDASPPAVSYALTPLARSLLEPLSILAIWAHRHPKVLRWPG